MMADSTLKPAATTAVVTCRVPAPLKAAISELAATKGHNLNQFMILLLEKASQYGGINDEAQAFLEKEVHLLRTQLEDSYKYGHGVEQELEECQEENKLLRLTCDSYRRDKRFSTDDKMYLKKELREAEKTISELQDKIQEQKDQLWINKIQSAARG